MSAWDDLIERLDRIEELLKPGQLPLDAIPMRALHERLEDVWNPEADKLLLPASVGAGEIGTLPSAALANDANFGVANAAWTKVTWDDTDWDTDNMADLANDRIRIRTPGIYLLTAYGQFAVAAGGAHRLLGIGKNGVLVGPNRVQSATAANPAAGQPRMSCATIDYAVTGDYYEVAAFQDSGGVLNIVGSATDTENRPRFQAAFIGGARS